MPLCKLRKEDFARMKRSRSHLDKQPSKKSKKNGVRIAVGVLNEEYTTIGLRLQSRRSLHRFCRRAQTYGNQSDVLNSQKPSYVKPTIETKINRLE